MAAKKGANLKAGEIWSDEFPGFILKANGVYRKPRVWIDKTGNERSANSYYYKSQCIVCQKVTFKEFSNARKTLNSVCSMSCRSRLMEKPDGHVRKKRSESNTHLMVKQKDHPCANNHGFVAQHRLIMEKSIGRLLKPEEQVHHINLLKDDNRLENLVLFSGPSEHFKSHGTLNKCVAKLIESGAIVFDRKTNSYEVV